MQTGLSQCIPSSYYQRSSLLFNGNSFKYQTIQFTSLYSFTRVRIISCLQKFVTFALNRFYVIQEFVEESYTLVFSVGEMNGTVHDC